MMHIVISLTCKASNINTNTYCYLLHTRRNKILDQSITTPLAALVGGLLSAEGIPKMPLSINSSSERSPVLMAMMAPTTKHTITFNVRWSVGK